MGFQPHKHGNGVLLAILIALPCVYLLAFVVIYWLLGGGTLSNNHIIGFFLFMFWVLALPFGFLFWLVIVILFFATRSIKPDDVICDICKYGSNESAASQLNQHRPAVPVSGPNDTRLGLFFWPLGIHNHLNKPIQKEYFDIILCHWPLLGVIVWAMTKPEDAFLEPTLCGLIIATLLILGHISALVYGIIRARHQKWPTVSFVGWVFSIILFSTITLPWLYWRHLRDEITSHA